MDDNSKVKRQVSYLGKWVDKDNFRVFVYKNGGQKLAESYDEYQKLIASGIWFASIDAIPDEIPKTRKSKHAVAVTDS